MTAGSTTPHAGQPGDTEEEQHRLTALEGLAALSLDALSSVAYGPQAILIVLATAGAAALHYTLPVTLAIVLLLAVLVISYRQVIEAFPGGGGAYAVAKAHLGSRASLIAAASLVIDYILNAAVGVSAGVEALTSAFPRLYPDRVVLCLAGARGDHGSQPMGRRRVGQAVHRPDAHLRRRDLRCHHRWPAPIASAPVPPGVALIGPSDGRHPAVAQSVRLRLLGADRGGGDRERSAGVQEAAGPAGAAHRDGAWHHSRPDVDRHRRAGRRSSTPIPPRVQPRSPSSHRHRSVTTSCSM